MEFSRRDALKFICLSCLSFTTFEGMEKNAFSIDLSNQFKKEEEFPKVEAKFYDKLKDGKIKCKICPQECEVTPNERGTCGTRENIEGKYYTLVHSRVCAAHIDPIEKKPLFHFLPGTKALSIATPGCNIECKYCQNWEISQFRPEEIKCFYFPPRSVALTAKKYKCPTIAYTYTEPTIFYEYMYDTAVEGKRMGVKSVMISNGYINRDPLVKLIPHLDAVKIDFKGFSEKFYSEICRGHLKPVLETLETIVEKKKWLEIVVLVIPTLNDSISENRNMFKWIKTRLGDSIPVHLTRFYPIYKLKNLPPTPISTLENLYKTAQDVGLKFPYIGNVPGHPYESTYCPSCKKILIHRVGFEILENNIKNNRCPYCGEYIPGIFK